jgi:ferredoxin-type protein NapG
VADTPAVIPLETPCYLCKDMPCIKACETGALLDLPRSEVEMGTAVINLNSCYLALGQPCDYCVERCPLKNEAIAFGPAGPPEINESSCTGCGVCAYLCPADAITIIPNTALDATATEET